MIAALSTIAERWSFEPTVVLPILLAGSLYLRGVRRARRRRPSSWRAETACFIGGLGVSIIALVSPVDGYADTSLSVHMVQHLLLTLVAPPLLLLGRPITLVHATSSRSTSGTITRISRSRLGRLVGSPLFGFAAFSIALWVSHVTSLYEATLDNEALHVAEHVAYLVTASLFWWPVVARDPGARRLSHPGRMLYLFLAMPMMSLLGFVIASSSRVLYVHYVSAAGSVAAASADQRLAGTIMWESSMLGGAVALSLVFLAWMRHDETEGRRADLLSGRTSEVAGG
jgi:putative membrane protein